MFFPLLAYRSSLVLGSTVSLEDLCAAAGVQCRASGHWTSRRIEVVVPNANAEPTIEAEPGYMGAVRITTPRGLNDLQAARYGLAAMAYGVFDLVARESVRGAPWARPDLPKGRKRNGVAKSNAQRQREFRARLQTQCMQNNT